MDIQEIKKSISENQIIFIRLLFTDLNGTLKNIEIPSNHLDDILNNRIKCDGSSIEGFVRIVESDMFLVPDLQTFRVFTWENSKTAGFICNLMTTNGQNFQGDSRYILQKSISKMRSLGFLDFNIGFEPEFYLIKSDLSFTDDGSYFDLAPNDASVDCRRQIIIELIKAGFNVEAGHHEVGPGQHEVTFKYSDALTSADNVLLFKCIVKTIASRYNLIATFIPKLKKGIAGNGMHVNMSLTDKDNSNSFQENHNLSNTAIYFINGILNRASEITAITNPTINSYKRLVSGFEAPCYIAYSKHNRSALIRIPAAFDSATRAELRMVDPSANPYLALSVILESGLEGIKNKMNTFPLIKEDIFKLNEKEKLEKHIYKLPETLKEALNCFQNSDFIKEVLSPIIIEKFIQTKTIEIEQYNQIVTDYEIKKYLNN